VARPRPNRSRPATRGPRAVGLLALGLTSALALAGCASVAPPRQPIAPEAQTARALLEERWRAFSDLRTLAEIRIRRGRTVQRLGGVLLLRAPYALRFEALSPLGTPVIIVATDARSVTLWEVLDQRAVILRASPEANRRWLGLPLAGEDLVALLAGRVRLLSDPLAADLLPPDAVGGSLRLTGPRSQQRVWFDPDTGQARQVEWTEGDSGARAVFAPSAVDGLPAGLTLSTQDGQLEVRVRYQDPRMNTGFDPGLLQVTVPEHVRIQDFR
jgi:outer membrane lipoprotein-sorting protein